MAPHAQVAAASPRQATAPPAAFVVNSPNVVYTDADIKARYTYRTTRVDADALGNLVATPHEVLYDFKVDRRVPRVGVMLVGWGGNNGTTVTAGILANRRRLV